MAPVAWESLLSLCVVNYLLFGLMMPMGARGFLCGPRGVIRITREVIDKAGLNWLLVPYQ
jgi:hypothetical protein